ncbi:MAG: hypothetical protein WHS64_03490 [Fervidobacterium sp.]|uniref:Uncharacterized protein n=1 Tax=Fervidobacterium gondwanense DSM 13020 TaxID=1121883 RepID=A0A1M7S0B1_FERGO|nr:hypothetical protein [Fervidobacterium gondwanense]SHN51933.1 hypothetical protein SAMN02745226_00394 [Fervidobacterium gondwanense DSM 13020]
MKRLYLIFSVVIVALVIFSCGIKIPEKAPEKVKLQYTKHLEFPITTLDFKIKDLVDDFEGQLGADMTLVKTDPVEIKYATEVVFSPGTFLKGIENELQNKLSEFGGRFDLSIDTNYLATQFHGSIDLPELQPVEQTISNPEIEIPDLTIISGQDLPVSSGQNNFSIPTSFLSTLIFDEANLKSVDVYLQISNVTASNPVLIVDGVSYSITLGTKTLSNILLKKSSSVILRFNSASAGIAKITLEFRNQKLNYFKNLDASQLDEEKISLDISQSISVVSGTWKLALDGNVGIQIIVAGFSGNITQTYTAKSGSSTIGSGSSYSLNASIALDETKKFTVGDGIQISGTIELTGTVSADFRIAPKVKFTPNVQVKKIEDYPVSLTVPLPENVTALSFTSGSGYMLLSFEGINITGVSGTFGSNALEMLSGHIKVPFGGISLPAVLNANISGDVGSGGIFYSLSLPNDQNIIIASATISGVSADPVVINQPVPAAVSQLADSATATIIVKLNYDVSNITGLNLNITSNFFDVGNGTHPLSGPGIIELKSENKNFDFSTFTNFSLTLTPNIPSAITVNNVNIRDGVRLSIEPVLEKFEISSVDIKPQTYSEDFGTVVDFGDVFSGDFGFLKELDFALNALLGFEITESTIPATMTLYISGDPVNLTKGETANIGDMIKQLIKDGSALELSITLQTGSGELTKDSEIRAWLDLTIPLQANTPNTDVVINEGTIDLSTLNQVKDIVELAQLKFGTYSNTTGLKAKLKLGDDVTITLTDTQPTIELNKAQIETLADTAVPYKIMLPANSTIALNYNGQLNVAPYLSVDLKVATEVSLK